MRIQSSTNNEYSIILFIQKFNDFITAITFTDGKHNFQWKIITDRDFYRHIVPLFLCKTQ